MSTRSANRPAADLRDPSIVPLNFTKSINLALSERGINAMKQSGEPSLVDHVMSATIPMRGRMIHGQSPDGSLYEHSQNYDVNGRVRSALTGCLFLSFSFFFLLSSKR